MLRGDIKTFSDSASFVMPRPAQPPSIWNVRTLPAPQRASSTAMTVPRAGCPSIMIWDTTDGGLPRFKISNSVTFSSTS